MVNTNKLRGAIVSAGYSQNDFAKILGISKNTLTAKLSGKSKIFVDEAKKMCEILSIESAEEKAEIFLS